MDRGQLTNDPEEAMRSVLDGRQADTWTAMPGIVESINHAEMTLSVQPSIKAPVRDEFGNVEFVKLPLLLDVPICFASAGGFTLTLPIKEDGEVLVIISSRAIDSWWQSSGVQKPIEARMNDLSDGFAIPGPRSLPNVISNIDPDRAQLRNDAGDVYLSLGDKFAMKNATADLKGTLSSLTLALTTFATGLNVGNLSTNATALVAALVAVDLKLTALLEDS